ncbi:MAG: hypothetical protein ACSLFE_00445 [Gemmatimonadaceae bacterium]
MHKVTHSVRRILPAELPTVTPLDGTERAMNEQEMLNIGVARIRGDIYSCAVQENTEDGRTWKPAVALPGVELSRGRPADRYRQLPAAVRAEVLNAQVERTTGTGTKRTTDTLVVPEPEIQPGDVVKQRGVVPHVWAGERDR